MTVPLTLESAHRKRVPVERINRAADQHGVAAERLRLGALVDRSRFFTCPSLTPLAYTAIYAELTPEHQRRYNQLIGLMQNELICFFEKEFAGGVLPALLARPTDLPPDLCFSMRRFLEEERQHTEMFRRLNRSAEPAWYANSDYHILRLPGPFLRVLRLLTRHPRQFPMVFWVMLIMEERSLLISRRYAQMNPVLLEQQFSAVYRAHAEDEARHVQIDWHLLDRLYQTSPRWSRRLNATLLELFIRAFFLRPRRANVRVVKLLIEEFPSLQPMRARLIQAVHDLSANSGYRQMMYSAEATPICSELFQRLPEFASLRTRLFEGAKP